MRHNRTKLISKGIVLIELSPKSIIIPLICNVFEAVDYFGCVQREKNGGLYKRG